MKGTEMLKKAVCKQCTNRMAGIPLVIEGIDEDEDIVIKSSKWNIVNDDLWNGGWVICFFDAAENDNFLETAYGPPPRCPFKKEHRLRCGYKATKSCNASIKKANKK